MNRSDLFLFRGNFLRVSARSQVDEVVDVSGESARAGLFVIVIVIAGACAVGGRSECSPTHRREHSDTGYVDRQIRSIMPPAVVFFL